MENRTERLQDIYNNLGRPGTKAFQFAAKRKGLNITENEAKAFVASQSIGQVFQGRIPSDGKLLGSTHEDTRWQMDLIDWSKRIDRLKGGPRFVLVAVDLHDRTVFTQPQPGKTAQNTLEGFRKIIRKNGGVMPKEITVDLGNEYAFLEAEINAKGCFDEKEYAVHKHIIRCRQRH